MLEVYSSVEMKSSGVSLFLGGWEFDVCPVQPWVLRGIMWACHVQPEGGL
jgi:hypothetical protein